MTTWYAPKPGTAAHTVRTLVRCSVWGGLALLFLLMADPYGRAAILSLLP